MGLIDDKQDIFTQIGALTSITEDVELPDITNSLSSINNKREIVPFMLDMLTTLVGSEALQNTVGEVMTGYIDNVEEDLKDALEKQFSTFNSDQALPSGFTGNGYTFNMGDIDLFEKTKTDPNTQVGSLLYNDVAEDFDNKLYEALKIPGAAITFGVVTLTYDDVLDTITIKPIDGNQTIGDFILDYIDSIDIINEKQFVSEIINLFFGTITTNQNKTLDTIIKEDTVAVAIQKVIDEEGDVEPTEDEISSIQESAQKKLEGIEYYDVGCGLVINKMTLDNLEGLISGTTGNTDPLTVGDAYLDSLIGGFEDADGDDSTIEQEKATANANTIKDDFFKNLINSIVNILVNAITTPPQIRALTGMFSGFKNNDIPQIGNPIEDIQDNINQVKCLADSARSTINEFLFNLVKEELMKLIIPVSKLILKEKINQYLAIIQSLVRLL